MQRVAFAAVLFVACLLYQSQAAQSGDNIPDYPGQVMLIKNTLTAVNHGNITGNYTVLRDLASERFRQNNTAADLADTFANLRKRKLDLSPILVADPKLTQQPGIDQFRQRLQLVGTVPTRPQEVRFELIFQRVSAGWMIDEISLAVVPAEAAQPSPSRNPPTSAPPAQPTSNLRGTQPPVIFSRRPQSERPR